MKELYNLGAMCKGQKGEVFKLNSTGTMRRRLQDIGLTVGTPVECVQISPFGDPAAYLIRGAVIALRSEDSCNVMVLSK